MEYCVDYSTFRSFVTGKHLLSNNGFLFNLFFSKIYLHRLIAVKDISETYCLRAQYRCHQITLAEEIYNTHAQVSGLLWLFKAADIG